MTRIRALNPSVIILLVFSCFVFLRYKHFITTEPIDSVDLHAHIDLIKKLKAQLLSGNLIFYDSTSFTGWPALVFYAFLPYLITTIISLPLDLFTKYSVELSTHLLIVTGLSLLNFIIYYAAMPFFNDMFENFKNSRHHQLKKEIQTFLALFISLFTFWFLKHNINLGASGIIHIGYYNQLFGWYALFIYIGLLYRYIQAGDKNLFFYCAVSLAAALLTHSLTAFYCMCIGGLCIMWFSNQRLRLLGIHLLGVLLTAFWLFPVIYYIGDYAVYNPVLGEHGPGLLKVFFEYPLYNEIISILNLLKGNFILLDYTNTLIIILLATALLNVDIRRTKLLSSLILFTILIAFLLINEYAISSLYLGIHYYRLIGLTIILYIFILSLVGVSLYKKDFIIRSKTNLLSYRITLIIVLIICFTTGFMLPNEYRKDPAEVVGKDIFKPQNGVLHHLKSEDKNSRVYFENFSDDKKYPPEFSVRYMPSVLTIETGMETALYTFIEHSTSYRLISLSANLLGSQIYGPSQLAHGRAKLSSDTLIGQLKAFGITHIVSTDGKFYKRVRPYSIKPPVSINNYQIITIQKNPFIKIEVPDKQIIGFIDLTGNLKFSLLDYYFYINENLTNNFELIQLDDPSRVPNQIDTLIINHLPGDVDTFVSKYGYEDKNILFINFEPSIFNINHYKPNYFRNIEKGYFINLSYYLDKVVQLPKRLVNGKIAKSIGTPDLQTANLSWNAKSQSFTMHNLQPGAIYRINYSYFPYFHTDEGTLFRGSKDRIFLIPDTQTVNVTFTSLYSFAFWIGVLCSIIALTILILIKIKYAINFKSITSLFK